MISEAKPLSVDVLGFDIPIKYVTYADLQCWGVAVYEPGCVELRIASEATGRRLASTIFHERLELALMIVGFSGDEAAKEQVICVAELLL